MRDQMQVGDGVLFYASNADPSGVTGLAEIFARRLSGRYAWKKGHELLRRGQHQGQAALVHGRHPLRRGFPRLVPLDVLKTTKGLEDMMVTRKGSRLSVQPVKKAEFDIVAKLGRSPLTVTVDRTVDRHGSPLTA